MALSERVLGSECLYEKDTAGKPQIFLFKRDVLDKNNNSKIPCLELPGSFYFVKIQAEGGLMWYFNNNKRELYSYNEYIRWVTRECTDSSGKDLVAPLLAQDPDGFDYALGRNIIERYGTILDSGKEYPARILVVIDADSGTVNTIYPEGYPLCICDIPCPYEKCACVKRCNRATVKYGEACDSVA
ncbi:Uncharacterised protein [uncultured archaeon]|nr:Uncharacterised protein [uncultured archaeon]